MERFEEPQATLIVLILDESGSMANQQANVIEGVNTLIREQRQGPDPARLMITKFNTAMQTVLEATDLDTVKSFTAMDYRPDGGTALYDAVVLTVDMAERQRRPIDRVLVQIITDGQENSSRRSTLAQVRSMITRLEGTGRWTFVYVGPDPEKWASETGTQTTNSAKYTPRAETYVAMNAMASSYRAQAAGTMGNLTTSKEVSTLLDPSWTVPTPPATNTPSNP